MTQIPAGTKFHGVAASIDTRDKKSATLNALSEAFSIEDINETILDAVIETAYLIDVMSLFAAITADPFDVENWKSSFTLSMHDGSILNGVYEANGDFSTEVSYSNMVGLVPSYDGTSKETVFVSATFKPTGGAMLGGIAMSSSVKAGGLDSIEWTYKYEENSAATGSNPKHLHDFRLTIDSTQVLGYVVINADDSEFHNFIIDSAAG
jgi:hypothetical protein